MLTLIDLDAFRRSLIITPVVSAAQITKGRGVYLYVLEGGPVRVNGQTAPALWAVMAWKKRSF